MQALLVQENALPLHPGFLEIDEQSYAQTRGLQVIDALRQMLVGKVVHALQFHEELFLNHQIGHILAHVLAFIANRKGDLSLGADAT